MKPPPTSSSSSSTSNLVRKARLSPYLFTSLAFFLFIVTTLYGRDDLISCILRQCDLDISPNQPLSTPKKHYKKLPFVKIKEKENGCDYFSGQWVCDPLTRPLYQESDCPYILPQFTCQAHGRPDRDYQSWRWQSHGCSLPRSQDWGAEAGDNCYNQTKMITDSNYWGTDSSKSMMGILRDEFRKSKFPVTLLNITTLTLPKRCTYFDL